AAALPRLPLGRWKAPAIGFSLLLLLLSVGIPLGVLVSEAGAPASYLQVARESGIAAWVSGWTGALAAVAAAALALPLALLAERRLGQLSGPGVAALAVLATVSYALPGALIAVALIGLLNRPGPLGALYDSAAVLPLTYLVRFFPF